MGKTKIKVIDAQTEEVKKPAKKLGRQDELVERLKAELADVGTPVEEPAKSSAVKATPTPDSGAKRTRSERAGDASGALRTDKSATTKSQKPGKAKPRSKKYQESIKDLDRSKTYSIDEAVEMAKKLSYSKFIGTLEAHINTVQTGMRGLVSLPFASGKKLQILAFGKGADSSGADIVGTESIVEEISKGKVNFDLIITTAEWMPKLAKVARILGPRGLMPNPKAGTITDDLKKAVESFQSGKTEYKTEQKAPVIHLGLGKLNQPTENLTANIKVLLQTLGKTRVKKVTLSPTMGPSVKVDLASI